MRIATSGYRQKSSEKQLQKDEISRKKTKLSYKILKNTEFENNNHKPLHFIQEESLIFLQFHKPFRNYILRNTAQLLVNVIFFAEDSIPP